MYESSYPGAPMAAGSGENDPFMPIEISAIANKLKYKPELLFGRLYYFLDAKHRYKQENGAHVSLFLLNCKGLGHCVHFPYLVSILAGHEEEHRKQSWSLAISVVALVLSLAAIFIQ
jgi:hypothetical protein